MRDDEDDALHHAGNSQRHDQRRHLEPGDANAVDQTDERTDAQRDHEANQNETVLAIRYAEDNDGAQCHNRANGQVNAFATADDNQRLTGGDDAQEGGQANDVDRLGGVQKVRVDETADQKQSNRQQ